MSQKLNLKRISRLFLFLPLFGFTLTPYSYGMTPEELQGKITVAVKASELPRTDIWQELPAFLSQRHVTTQLRGNFSRASKVDLVFQDAGKGIVAGAVTGLGLGALSIFLDQTSQPLKSKLGFSIFFIGAGIINGEITGYTQGLWRSIPLFSKHPWAQIALESSLGVLSSMSVTGFLCLAAEPNKKTPAAIVGMVWGFLNSIAGSIWIEADHIPPYGSLTEEDREALLKTYLYACKPELTPSLEIAEKESPLEVHEMAIPIPLKQGMNRPTAMALYQGSLKGFLVASALNGSDLAYALEDNPTLRGNAQDLLNKMNEGLSGTLWLEVQCFDVVTGNYGRYQAGKRSVAFLGTRWKKQPAIVAWARPQGHPGLILVAFKGTNFSSHADQISDIKILPKDLGGKGQVHSGFCDIADSAVQPLSQSLPSICQVLQQGNQGVQVLFTGHSMGAAVALISSFKEILGKGNPSDNRKNEALVMNFGQPRVCARGSEGTFQALLGPDNLLRFVATDKEGRKDPIAGYRENDKDTFGYRHFGHEILLKSPRQVRTTLIGGSTSIHPLSSYRKSWEETLKK